MLRCPGRKATPDDHWWMKVQKSVAEHVLRHKGSITFEPSLSEAACKRAMLTNLIPSGTAEFLRGRVVRLLGSENDSFLHSYYDAGVFAAAAVAHKRTSGAFTAEDIKGMRPSPDFKDPNALIDYESCYLRPEDM